MPELLLGVAESLQVLARQVDSAALGVLTQVAQDVRELKGDPRLLGVLLCLVPCEAPDVNARQADHRGDVIAIALELGERVVTHGVEVHADAVDGLVEIAARHGEGADQIAQGGRNLVRRLAGKRAIERFPPGGEAFAFFGDGAGGVAEVVADAEKGVEAAHRATLVRGEDAKGMIEVARLAPGQPFAERIGASEGRVHSSFSVRIGVGEIIASGAVGVGSACPGEARGV